MSAAPLEEKIKIPGAFILRRAHSLLGLWLVLYLFEHLLVNSQAALFTEDQGSGFVAMVNQIHALPYLPVIEIVFLGIPFLVHGVWGVTYLFTARHNSLPTDGTRPELTQYKRNHAYSWQRYTSWILLFGILAHVIHMRFVDYPTLIYQWGEKEYLIPLRMDPGLYAVANTLGVAIYDRNKIEGRAQALREKEDRLKIDSSKNEEMYETQMREERIWVDAAEKIELKKGDVLAIAKNAGTAFLFILRDVFKNIGVVILYSLLVIATVYHAFNGLWTFLITWGVTLTQKSQKRARTLSTIFMVLVGSLGLMAAWGSYLTTFPFKN